MKMLRLLTCATSCRILFAAVASLTFLTGCASKPTHTLGITPVNATASVTTKELSSLPVGKMVVLEGEMIEKCPAAGCWFMLKDKTGVVRVDTKSANFFVMDVPLHTKMKVSGSVAADSQTGINASGIRY